MENVAKIAKDMMRDFLDYRLDEVAEHYSFPVVVFFGPEIFVLSDKQDYIERAKSYRKVLDDRGVARGETVVQDVQVVEPERFQVELLNVYFTEDDVHLTETVIRFFMDIQSDGPKVRMLEYLVTPFNNETIDEMFPDRS